jgi:hypothetical protein
MLSIERNTAFVAGDIREYIRRNVRLSTNTYFIREDRTRNRAHPDVGVITSNALKEVIYEIIKRAFFEEVLFIDEKLIEPRPRPDATATAAFNDEMPPLMEARRQFNEFYVQERPSRHGRLIKILHGKFNDAMDDIVMAFMMAMFGLHQCLRAPQYAFIANR